MKIIRNAFILFLLLGVVTNSIAQISVTDYERAEKFLRRNVDKLIKGNNLSANWIENESKFWFIASTDKGNEYYIVDCKSGKKRKAFNQEKLGGVIGKLLKTDVDIYNLPIQNLQFDLKNNTCTFINDSVKFKFDLKSEKLYSEPIEETFVEKDGVSSPNEQWIAFGRDYNVYVKHVKTGREKQITFDGEMYNAYGEYISWYTTRDISKSEEYETSFYVKWSPDSKRILIPKYDRKDVELLYMYQSTPEDDGVRAHVKAYHRPIAGDSAAVTVSYSFYDVEKDKHIKSKLSPTVSFLEWGLNWMKDSKHLSMVRYNRGFSRVEVLEIDALNGSVRSVHNESSDTYVEPGYQNFEFNESEDFFFWTSELDGWNHLYQYDWESGKLINQVTKGDFFVRKLMHIDSKKGKVYFLASGKEKDRDPYFQHFYVSNFDGSELRLLTPENAEHSVQVSEDNKYFIDHYSSFDTPDVFVLKRLKDGKKISIIQEADISKLKELGWKPAEPFQVKARDGKTNLYGLIYWPTNYDPNKLYPVIHSTYSGPHTIRTPKSFYRCTQNMDLALAELGFVVVSLDGLGSAYRSKEFHNYSWKNLGDNGQPDFIKAIRELKKKYSYLDTSRVGIYGHSAGGYDAAHALLVRGDFYKVGVASAGNHDHRVAKAWWPELYMGYPAGKEYDEQSNFNLAANLKGKLLLAHGDLDQNVNPNASIRMAAECVKANRDVDLLLIPNADHGQLYWDKYFIRKRWDYFVKHLLGAEPPKNYKIK